MVAFSFLRGVFLARALASSPAATGGALLPVRSASPTSGSVNTYLPIEDISPINIPADPEDGIRDGPENLRLRLVVPSPPTPEMPALVNRSLHLNGQDWYLTELFMTPDNAATFPNYTATSYRWYDGRLPNPFFDGFLMSNLTLPSLESTMRNSPHDAFWIDCFSIPAEPPLKGKILDLLPNIFSAASEVIVPLGLNSRSTLPLIAGNADLTNTPAADLEAAILDIDQEQWVRSIWTYKESMNAKRYIFTDRSWTDGAAASTNEPQVADIQFFKRVAEGLMIYSKSQNWTDYETFEKLPNVDGLVNIGLDRQLSGATYSRSVFQSLSSLDRRFVESDKNFFWGLYGAITEQAVPEGRSSTLSDLYGFFFEVCETKNDFSFIYTTAERSTIPGKTFYPAQGQIHSILTWATDGNYQTANITDEGIKLDGMVTLEQKTALGQRGQNFIADWFASGIPENAGNGGNASVVSKVLKIIQMIGFTGSGDPIFTEDGIFFPQWVVPSSNAVDIPTVLVTSQLGWPFGSPGFAKVKGQYVPGAFIGHVAAQEARTILM
ncbi:hypothetical protein KVR01_008154 [Diaporthe batatas]|uniref:uncharacterized protein n=1 Tax=Diaporthe batatas TaxID=748121 RepID=UPI001D04A09B|nr:uncharacterized protein KVR01_008154 [Diaporthe batatas]KAG8162389.1 hypothetical protein KVR01_008154 [Diaporthe batatas]